MKSIFGVFLKNFLVIKAHSFAKNHRILKIRTCFMASFVEKNSYIWGLGPRN